MKNIFEGEQSIYQSGTTDIKDVMHRIADRYMAAHPWQSFGMRPYIDCGFKITPDSCVDFNFGEKFPNAKDGAYCYAMSYVENKTESVLAIHIDARYWSELYINGELIAKTTVSAEAIPQKTRIVHTFKPGRNVVFIKARKNVLGLRALFGEGIAGNKPICFRAPFAENEGCQGWLYTKPFDEDIYKTPEDFPKIDDPQPDFWYPTQSDFMAENVFPNESGYIYACSRLANLHFTKNVNFVCESNEAYTIYVDGEEVFSGKGKNEFPLVAKTGFHYVAAEIKHGGDTKLQFDLKAFADEKQISFVPFEIVRTNHPWLYMGVLKEKNETLRKKVDINLLGETASGYTYYRAGMSDLFMRPVREDATFGAWNYPLGVVMYGLLETAKALNANWIADYAVEHMFASTKIHRYILWDKDTYGVANLNGFVASLTMLDFCGSFGNAVILGSEFTEDNKTMFEVADYIADYIRHKQERLENGMFFRIRPGTIHDNTIWADDLYMSVPFLCRYYKLSGDKSFLEDAVNQILRFKEYLYMPDKKLMSHVYSLPHKTNTAIPWGRGNGWTLFSFSELLMTLPKDHEKRDELLSFFRELSEGILANQDENGMWHQLIDDHDSYCETSCTAMFTCAFARGVRYGWLDKKFADSAFLGWNGLCNHAIDSNGDVYGVCVGSRYSFRREYYKYELPWHTNDLHGTGIVLLAGTEVNKLIESL